MMTDGEKADKLTKISGTASVDVEQNSGHLDRKTDRYTRQI